MTIPRPEQLECALRELQLRRRNYPKWVDARRMTQEDADIEIARMSAIVNTLEMLVLLGQVSDQMISEHEARMREQQPQAVSAEGVGDSTQPQPSATNRQDAAPTNHGADNSSPPAPAAAHHAPGPGAGEDDDLGF